MKKIIVANWKMNPDNVDKAKALFADTTKAAKEIRNAKIVVCPPFVYLNFFKPMSGVGLGSQDVFWEDDGPYTGEVSAKMLKNLGVEYVIIGHSERRQLGETDEIINKKIKQALKNKLKVIFCAGELERDEGGEYLQFVKDEIIKGLDKIPAKLFKNLIITYEPVWAISSSAKSDKARFSADTPENAQEMAIYAKRVLVSVFGKSARNIPVLYGGSVDAKNAASFLNKEGIDGLLVGRTSWNAKTFGELLKNIYKVTRNA
ncbi:MAG: triose-phosphate isomerase [Candidatus Tagabacteria bacterium]